MTQRDAWPALPYEEWAPTKKTLQMCAQMLGKTRLALAPPQPEWLNACLYLDSRGFATGPMPTGSRVLTARIDIFDADIHLDLSDGRGERIPVAEGRCVADIWADYSDALRSLGVDARIWEKPQELADTAPFSENRHDCVLVPEHAQRFHRVLTSANAVFEEFRSRFFGRSGVQFWWGSFDHTVLLFNGKHATAPDDRGYIMRYDLDAEHMNAGFWPGDDNAPAPGFYAYLVPQPPGCDAAPIGPRFAGWVESMGEWVMPYDSVRTCDDPAAALREFLDSVYAFAVAQAGWDGAGETYVKPPVGHEPA
jgi:hypothetical protein